MGGDFDGLDRSLRRPVADPNPPKLLNWPTERLVALDELSPGLLRRLLTSAPRSRQSIFTALAITRERCVHDGDFADVLRVGKARDIVRFVVGHVPDGFLGALERIGTQVLHRPAYYDVLLDLFSDPKKRRQAAVLRHCGRISALTLDAVTLLEPQWLHVSLLTHARNLGEVADFQGALKLLQSLPNGPSDESIYAALLELGPKTSLSTIITKLIKRTGNFPDPPMKDHADFRPLRSGDDLVQAGRRFRNCLRNRLLTATVGRYGFAIYKKDAAIVEFRRLGSRASWLLFDVHGPENRPLPDDFVIEVRAACASAGIDHLSDDLDYAQWTPLVRMAQDGGLFDFAA
jgi:hypothetical protein